MPLLIQVEILADEISSTSDNANLIKLWIEKSLYY
mgnify:CR=1 FL=1